MQFTEDYAGRFSDTLGSRAQSIYMLPFAEEPIDMAKDLVVFINWPKHYA